MLATASIASGALATFFVIGGKTDDEEAPAHVLMCEDEASFGYLAACFVISE